MPSMPVAIAGRELRYRLTLVLHDTRRPLTVQELLVALDQTGNAVAGRQSKTVSDALRWEIRRWVDDRTLLRASTQALSDGSREDPHAAHDVDHWIGQLL